MKGVLVFVFAIGLATRAHLLYGQEQERLILGYTGIELKEGKHSVNNNSTEMERSIDDGTEYEVTSDSATASPKFVLMVA
jgi:hypothetical protein